MQGWLGPQGLPLSLDIVHIPGLLVYTFQAYWAQTANLDYPSSQVILLQRACLSCGPYYGPPWSVLMSPPDLESGTRVWGILSWNMQYANRATFPPEISPSCQQVLWWVWFGKARMFLLYSSARAKVQAHPSWERLLKWFLEEQMSGSKCHFASASTEKQWLPVTVLQGSDYECKSQCNPCLSWHFSIILFIL